MSHELRTPLNGIIGYSRVLTKEHDLSEKNRERLRVVASSGEHLLQMINEVLDFSKIEAGKLDLQVAPFSLEPLLRDVVAAFEARAEQKGLEFQISRPVNLPGVILGDAQKLRQVLENLLGNAIKFTLTGRITLQVTRNDERLAFGVTDTGVGIGTTDLARLFQPFQQAIEGRPAAPGTGLGLAICQRLVELMGGSLTVASTPGQGSTFSFSVPLEEIVDSRPRAAEAPRVVVGYAGPRQRVLVVDDVAVNRALLDELLSPLGFLVQAAADGAQALQMAPVFAPRVVFLDLRMPGMDGYELARRLRALPGLGQAKLIAMSASVLSFNRADAFASGCDDFLGKPFRESDLIDKLGLHLSLEWIYAAPADANPASGANAPCETFAPLLAAARGGDIATLRRGLSTLRARWPTDARLAQLDSLAADYQMEKLRDRLVAWTSGTATATS
jgi:CheY-like chemotaxis protein/anti-sigma regulatory factor (Ser/Thr protein kinase)